MKALRWSTRVAVASFLTLSLLTQSAPAQKRVGGDEGGLAGAGIPALTTVRYIFNDPTATPPVSLIRPIFVTYAPGDPTRLFIIEKRGLIRVAKIDVNPPVLLATPFLDLDSQIAGGTSQASEQGLLGLAFHPNYQQNGYFYVYYTANSFANTVARFRVSANPDVAVGSNTTGDIVLQQADNESNHNGGWIAFKPGDTQGYLYVAIGDGGGGCDNSAQHDPTTGNGQSINTLFGKMLRIDIDGADNTPGTDDDDGVIGNGLTNGHTNPPSNPFFGATAGLDEIWDYGLRNPWRPSFDRATGDLYIADVGQVAWEEVNFEPGNSTGGRNYGWRCMEATHPSSDSACSTANCPTTSCGGALLCPIHEYFHNGTVCSITGGYVYRGLRMPQLQGTYFFADYNCSIPGSAPIWSFNVVGGAVANFQSRTAELAPSGGFVIDTLTSFGEDYFGEMYICDQEGGEIFKIIPVPCYADIIPDGTRDVNDLLQVITTWGPCGSPCPGDIVVNGAVDVNDLLAVISNWGLCP